MRPAPESPYHIRRLPSGLPVVLRPMPHAASVAIGVWVRVGGRYEPLAHAGISHFIEHMLFKGTRRRSCEALKQAIEGIGGTLNGFTAEEFTCYLANVPAKYLGRGLTILSDMVLHSTFRPRDLERERDVILEEIRMSEDNPGQRVHELFSQLLWPNHPLGMLLAGTEETVRRIQRPQLVDYWRRFYQPRNLLVVCAGALDPERTLRQARLAFAGPSRRAAARMMRAPRLRPGPHVQVMHKQTEQTHVCLGVPAMPRTHPQRFAVELLHVVLGANMSSRLFREVRERRGLVYEIGTHVRRYHDTGAFVIYAGCDVSKLESTLRIVTKELSRIKRELVPARELARAKEFYHGQLVMSLEDTMDHMLWMGEQVVTVGRLSTPQDVTAALKRVTARHIREAARRLFLTPRMYLAAIGPVPQSQAAALHAACVLP